MLALQQVQVPPECSPERPAQSEGGARKQNELPKPWQVACACSGQVCTGLMFSYRRRVRVEFAHDMPRAFDLPGCTGGRVGGSMKCGLFGFSGCQGCPARGELCSLWGTEPPQHENVGDSQPAGWLSRVFARPC